MASSGSVWGIEIGQVAVKGVKLRGGPEGVELVAYDVVEHPKILSQPDANREELVTAGLKKFAERNDPKGERWVIGVPGQQTFARFCKLPPADPKKIPALVVYEAQQQIPFEMADVVWDYQKFEDPDSPDVEVGIFAMRKDLIQKHLDQFDAARIRPYMVQTIPSALFNFARYEYEDGLKEGALVVIDVGTQNTDLIIVEPHRAWTRNIPLGGSAFTEALVRAFKLSFGKAEQLKRTAASSKYARQIFQAMRPVFAELVAEVQRSIGFYSSTHRETELKQVLAVGSAFRLAGLQKYIENNLTIAGGVAKFEKFRRIRVAPEVDQAKLNDQMLNLAAATGLALQGLGEAKIKADLLPPELARLAIWKHKQWWFAGAAAVAGLAAVLPVLKNSLDQSALAGNDVAQAEVSRIVSEAQRYQQELQRVRNEAGGQVGEFAKYEELLAKKRVIPGIIALLHQAIPQPDPALAAAKTPEEFRRLVQSDPAKYSRTRRKQIFIDGLTIDYVPNIESISLLGPSARAPGFATESGASEAPGFLVHVQARVPYGSLQSEISAFMTDDFFAKVRELAAQPGLGFHMPREETVDPSKTYIDPDRTYARVQDTGWTGPGAPAGPSRPGGTGGAESGPPTDPVTGEPIATDWRVEFDLKFKLGDAPPPQNSNPADTTPTSSG